MSKRLCKRCGATKLMRSFSGDADICRRCVNARPDPTAEEIAARCAAVQDEWNESTERRRRVGDEHEPYEIQTYKLAITDRFRM